MYMFRSSGPLTEKKLSEHEVATAFARSVLPVPGGPYSKMPVCACVRVRPEMRCEVSTVRNAGTGERAYLSAF
jgi:hypothetical protein